MDTNTKAVALTVFLAVATSVFALFISAYTIRMEEPDWRPISEPTLLWANTADVDPCQYCLSLDPECRG